MNKKIFLTFCLLLAPGAILLAGCNDETVPDPELVKARDEQRRAMDPANGRGNAPTPDGQAPGATTGQ